MAFLELSNEGKSVSYNHANGTEYVFEYAKKTKVDLNMALGFLGADEYKVTFDLSDKDAIAGASDWAIKLLKAEFNVLGDKEDLLKTMFPVSKPKKIVKKVQKAVVPVKPTTPKPVTAEKKTPSKVDKAKASSDE